MSRGDENRLKQGGPNFCAAGAIAPGALRRGQSASAERSERTIALRQSTTVKRSTRSIALYRSAPLRAERSGRNRALQ